MKKEKTSTIVNDPYYERYVGSVIASLKIERWSEAERSNLPDKIIAAIPTWISNK